MNLADVMHAHIPFEAGTMEDMCEAARGVMSLENEHATAAEPESEEEGAPGTVDAETETRGAGTEARTQALLAKADRLIQDIDDPAALLAGRGIRQGGLPRQQDAHATA